jgi:hypothetical protein
MSIAAARRYSNGGPLSSSQFSERDAPPVCPAYWRRVSINDGNAQCGGSHTQAIVRVRRVDSNVCRGSVDPIS